MLKKIGFIKEGFDGPENGPSLHELKKVSFTGPQVQYLQAMGKVPVIDAVIGATPDLLDPAKKTESVLVTDGEHLIQGERLYYALQHGLEFPPEAMVLAERRRFVFPTEEIENRHEKITQEYLDQIGDEELESDFGDSVEEE